MQSILRPQHALCGGRLSDTFLLTTKYQFASVSRQAWRPPTWLYLHQHRFRYYSGGDSLIDRGDLASNQRDGRKRLSSFWTPTGGIEAASGDADGDSHSLLIRGGFVRQAHAGLFQLLPMGLRIQEKLEKLLAHHMEGLGASKVALSTLSSQDLWKRSGRLPENGRRLPEIFQFRDRKEAGYILSPTHEEEITSLVGSIIKSYKDLPLKLYQITRKYRDEARPRQGLLRTREFLMKDLYTFDVSSESALRSYESVRKAYTAFFDELKIPYLVAKAASGEMGGDLSHEFHFPTSKGEDNVVSCSDCDYVANEELAEAARPSRFVTGREASVKDLKMLLDFASNPQELASANGLYRQWLGCSKDRATIVQAIYPTQKALLLAGLEASEESQINQKAVQQAFADLDLSVEMTQEITKAARNIFRLYDATIVPPSAVLPDVAEEATLWSGNDAQVVYKVKDFHEYRGFQRLPVFEAKRDPGNTCNLLKLANGDKCAKCESGRLSIQTAVELGHTFHLGTRYSKPLNATVAMDPCHKSSPSESVEQKAGSDLVFMQMGCHGIGVSRLIAAVANSLVDSRGLNWPRVMAPFEAVVVPTKAVDADSQTQVYDALTISAQGFNQSAIDVILDDRQRDLGWKLTDADMIGYPLVVVIGRGWREKKCEVQCRRLAVKQEVHIQELKSFVEGLLDKL